MKLTARKLGIALCLAVTGCFGGPTSDWPKSNNPDGDEWGDDGEGRPTNNIDAGVSNGGNMDSSSEPPLECCRDELDAGVPDGSTCVRMHVQQPGDAGCR